MSATAAHHRSDALASALSLLLTALSFLLPSIGRPLASTAALVLAGMTASHALRLLVSSGADLLDLPLSTAKLAQLNVDLRDHIFDPAATALGFEQDGEKYVVEVRHATTLADKLDLSVVVSVPMALNVHEAVQKQEGLRKYLEGLDDVRRAQVSLAIQD